LQRLQNDLAKKEATVTESLHRSAEKKNTVHSPLKNELDSKLRTAEAGEIVVVMGASREANLEKTVSKIHTFPFC
jgi:nitrate reductase NapAB chaperone NapD